MAKTPSCITELRLKVNCEQARRLLVRKEAVRQVYGACLGKNLKRLKLMRESQEYQAARKLPKGEPKSEAWEARRSAFGAVRQRFQFREYALHDDAKPFGHSGSGDHLDSHVVQKVATGAFKVVLRVGVGRAGRLRFKGKNQIDSLEGKSHKTGILWREGQVQGKGLVRQPIYPRKPDPVIEYGLGSRVKVVRIVRRKINGKTASLSSLSVKAIPITKRKTRLAQGRWGSILDPPRLRSLRRRPKKRNCGSSVGN